MSDTNSASTNQNTGSDDSGSDPLAAAMPVEDAPDIPESMLLGGVRMIRDERGVRLEDVGDEDGD